MMISSLTLLLLAWLMCTNALVQRSEAFYRGTQGPPTDVKRMRGGGSENGIRIISKEECQSSVSKWMKGLGIVSESNNFSKLEILMRMDEFSRIMPGLNPKRNELVAFGEFVDGNLECISAIYWKKVTFPSEMDVIALIQAPNVVDDKCTTMVQYVCELCLENAIIPNFSPLEGLETFERSNFKKVLRKYKKPKRQTSIDDTLKEVIELYSAVNRAPSVCLDNIPAFDLGPYWFQTFAQNVNNPDVTIPVYFRKKKGRDFEFETLFQRPQTGTSAGSGTVGGALILSAESAHTVVHGLDSEAVLTVADAIKRKINHPNI